MHTAARNSTFSARSMPTVCPPDILEKMHEKNGAVEQLDFKRCAECGQQIYLFIDEYDHFTNKILSEPACLNDYKSETYGTGYLRSFFDTVKSCTESSIKRCFVIGVSPVTMNDLTSGFNIGTNYSLSVEFNELTGFTEEDVRQMLDYYATTCEFHHTTDELVKLMKPWYDNYCFAEDSYGCTTMCNSNMVLYFVDNYVRNEGKPPKNMVEENIRVDYNKLRMLIRKDKEFAHNTSIIQKLMEQGFVTGELKAGFPPRRLPIPTISSACCSISVCSLSTARMKEIPNWSSPTKWCVSNYTIIYWILTGRMICSSRITIWDSYLLVWLTEATGRRTSATSPTACTVTPLSATSRRAKPTYTVSPSP